MLGGFDAQPGAPCCAAGLSLPRDAPENVRGARVLEMGQGPMGVRDPMLGNPGGKKDHLLVGGLVAIFYFPIYWE